MVACSELHRRIQRNERKIRLTKKHTMKTHALQAQAGTLASRRTAASAASRSAVAVAVRALASGGSWLLSISGPVRERSDVAVVGSLTLAAIALNPESTP